ncbi:MAG: IS630 family transposase [Actinobacteria bacterium]|nr:MAG: IS630 family transposase [Actinomycetota bacterium]
MAERGRPRQLLTVTDDDREVLVRWSKRPKSPFSIAQRARIVLLAADGLSNDAVAERVGVNQATVVKWRKRFLAGGLDGLLDEPRPGAPRTITDADVEAVVVRTLEDKPTDATHWSTRDLAKTAGVSASSVGRIWRAFGLKPWLADTFKLSEDPQFVDKVRDVVGLYMNPPEHAVVLCVDEKTSIQALDRTQPILPMRPGQIERRTHDYKRNGVTDLFAALNLATGHVVHQTRAQHRAIEFRKFLDAIDTAVPANLDVHVVLDNSSTHKTEAIKTWLLRHPRFTFHFTPTSSSWLNLVERWFAELTRKMLQRSAHKSVAALTADLNDWIAAWNDNPKPFVWHKTADQILDSLKKYLTNL